MYRTPNDNHNNDNNDNNNKNSSSKMPFFQYSPLHPMAQVFMLTCIVTSTYYIAQSTERRRADEVMALNEKIERQGQELRSMIHHAERKCSEKIDRQAYELSKKIKKISEKK